MNDREHNKSLNLKTGNWHGENLEAYRKGYEEGYRKAERGDHHDMEHHEGEHHDFGSH
jgi:hypothetical protein